MGVVAKDIFSYEIDFLSVPPAGSISASLTIDVDSKFLWQKSFYFADVAAAGQTDSSRVIPLATVLITDTGSARQFMNTAVPIPAVFGTGQLPFILPNPRELKGGSVVRFQVSNFDAAQTYNIRLTLFGQKIFMGS